MGNLVVNTGTAQAILVDTAGTVDVGVVKIDTSAAGTFGSLWNGAVSVGTLPNLPGGSIVVTSGTIASDTIIGGTINLTQTVSTVSMLSAGTITTLPNIPGGTITNLASGTINSATAVINSATISVLPNLPQGSINVTAGTMVMNSGTLTTGTILSSGTTTGVGTISNIGSVGMLNAATISVLPNLPQGSIQVTAGTVVMNSGTITTGTILSSGTTTGVGSVSNVGSIAMLNAGTITTLPNIPGGTITNLVSGTINSATAVINSATISVLPNLPQGSINVTSGTINTGTIANLVQAYAGTLNNVPGTISTFIIGGAILGYDGANLFRIVLAPDSDTVASDGNQLRVGAMGRVWNGTTWDRMKGNTGGVYVQGTTSGTINAIKSNYGAVGTLNITVAALASSTAGVGRQSDLVDNTVNLYRSALIAAQITAGSVTTAGNLISLYLIRSDGTLIRDDGAGTGDAAFTQKNAGLLGYILVPELGTAVQYKAVFDTSIYGNLGPQWGVAVVHSLGNNLHATGGSHSITYKGIT
jgi:hypothetical protein